MTRIEADIYAALVAAGYTASTIRAEAWDEDHTIIICAGGGLAEITSTSTLQKPWVQIQTRSVGSSGSQIEAAKTVIWDIINLFHQNESIANCVGAIWNGRQPDRWVDDNGRVIYSAEFDVWKEL
ncbi:MAG: minor capsid protein [Methanoregulaceae archaeon]|jgi:hypothetical protein|nr:minor capsid protein [Methanoregulaceae archaeon]